MPYALIALGSNLGDRAAQLGGALAALQRVPQTCIIARSAWHETPPVGGPRNQGAFLNGAVLASTGLAPESLLTHLLGIEAELGRVRVERWAARKLDLDLLLYDGVHLQTPQVELPHPRMHYRHFVLRPAAEIAPWMVHPETGWTIARLLAHWERSVAQVEVAGQDAAAVRALVSWLGEYFRDQGTPLAVTQRVPGADCSDPRGMLLAIAPTGSDPLLRRKMLRLPPGGPIVWVEPGDAQAVAYAARDAIISAWPDVAGGRPG